MVVHVIGIGGHLAMSLLPHHRAYGSRTRRFRQHTEAKESSCILGLDFLQNPPRGDAP